MKRIGTTRLVQAAMILALGGAIFAFFQLRYRYHFYYQEQEMLFVMDWEYVTSHYKWNEGGWMARLAGDFLTQFGYYMYAGAAILTGMLLVVGDLARRATEGVVRLFVDKQNAVWSWVAFAVGVAMMAVGMCWAFDINFTLASVVCLAGLCGGVWIGTWLIKSIGNWYLGTGACVVITVLALWLFGLPTKDFGARFVAPDYKMERLLAFDNEYYFGHYDRVIDMGRQYEADLTDEESFFFCMALAQRGALADMLPTLKRANLGTFYKVGPETPRFVIRMIDDLYFLIGDMTYTERAALLANTFSKNGRSARKLKRLAEANLVNGDTPAAMKYLRLLEKTIVYRRWAKDRMPGSQTERVKAEIAHKQQFVNTNDDIRIGDDCYTILTQLLDSNRDNVVALDYLLCSNMLAHDKEIFVSDYEKYGPSLRGIFEEIYREVKSEK